MRLLLQLDQRLVPNLEDVHRIVELVVPILGALLVVLLRLHRRLVEELFFGGDVRGRARRGLFRELLELLELRLFLFGELEIFVGVLVFRGEMLQDLLVVPERGARVERGGRGGVTACEHLLGSLRGVHRGLLRGPFRVGATFALGHRGELVHHLLLLVEKDVVLLRRDVLVRVDLALDFALGVLVVEEVEDVVGSLLLLVVLAGLLVGIAGHDGELAVRAVQDLGAVVEGLDPGLVLVRQVAIGGVVRAHEMHAEHHAQADQQQRGERGHATAQEPVGARIRFLGIAAAAAGVAGEQRGVLAAVGESRWHRGAIDVSIRVS